MLTLRGGLHHPRPTTWTQHEVVEGLDERSSGVPGGSWPPKTTVQGLHKGSLGLRKGQEATAAPAWGRHGARQLQLGQP